MVEQAHQIRPEYARVLVTGATSGVGEATARLLASRGARIAALARRSDELQRVVADLGDRACGFVADVSDPGSASSAVSAAIDELGGLDVAVNAAGVAGFSNLEDLSYERWREVIDTNLSGTFTVSRAAGLHMRAAGAGAIVNVASDLASMGVAGLAHYCAAKAGVVGLTRALAVELAPVVRAGDPEADGRVEIPLLDVKVISLRHPASFGNHTSNSRRTRLQLSTRRSCRQRCVDTLDRLFDVLVLMGSRHVPDSTCCHPDSATNEMPCESTVSFAVDLLQPPVGRDRFGVCIETRVKGHRQSLQPDGQSVRVEQVGQLRHERSAHGLDVPINTAVLQFIQCGQDRGGGDGVSVEGASVGQLTRGDRGEQFASAH